MASKEKQRVANIPFKKSTNSIVFPNELFGDHLYDPFLETETFNLSPNGPLSDMNFCNGSSYSSPLGSENGSTETESEDEVSLAELTRRVAEYTFQGDDEEDENFSNLPTDFLPEKPQASLTTTKFSQYNSSSYVYDQDNEGFISTPQIPSAESEIHSLQVHEVRNQAEVAKKGSKSKGVVEYDTEQNKGKAWRSNGAPKRGNLGRVLSAQGGSEGMRAVFLDGSKSKTGSSGGTGVFLPSAVYSKEEPPKKPACSTVLIPARVLHTLQQHFQKVNAQSESQNASGYTSNKPWQTDILKRINGLLSQQKENAEFQAKMPATNRNLEELRLPQEWTY